MAGNSSSFVPDVGPVLSLVHQTRRVLRSSWIMTGLGIVIGVALAALLTVTLADLIVPFLPAIRFMALMLVIVPATWVFFVGVVRPLIRKLSEHFVARRIEKEIPGIHNRLVSCIDLSRGESADNQSPAFLSRLVSEALDRIHSFRSAQVVDIPSMKRAGIFAASTGIAFIIALTVLSDRLPTALARIFNPFADIPPASSVAYDVIPGDTKVLRGDEFILAALVTKGSPEELKLEITIDGVEDPIWHNLQQDDEDPLLWDFSLVGLENSLSYRVHGGGTWSVEHRVTMIDRPQIEQLNTVIRYPDYMKADPITNPADVVDLSELEQSGVEVLARVKGDPHEGFVHILEKQTRRVKVEQREERFWFKDSVPSDSRPQGKWQWSHDESHPHPVHSHPAAPQTQEHGFQSDRVGFRVQPGEELFTHVYVSPDNPPTCVMVEWHDGSNWEHRAYWGADTIARGKPETPARRRLGDVPPSGKWTKLVIPVETVGLAQNRRPLRGIRFLVHGGEALWGPTGVVAAEYEDKIEFITTQSLAMKPRDDGLWAGSFTLSSNGYYRVEMKNELGFSNKTMAEAHFVALPDEPPQVSLENPDRDLVLSAPTKVPMMIAARDDWALSDIVISTQRKTDEGFIGVPIQSYEGLTKNDIVVTNLDLESMGLKIGDELRYRVEARDRKGQSAQTKEYVIRIRNDKRAADQQLARLEQQADAFENQMDELIKQQETITKQLEKLERLESIENQDASAQDQSTPPPAKDDRPQAAPKNDPAKQKLSAEQVETLKRNLEKVLTKQKENLTRTQNVANQLKSTAEQAANMPLMPKPISKQMEKLSDSFVAMAQDPMRDLARQMQEAAEQLNPDNPAGQDQNNLKQMERSSERLEQELQAMQERMDALQRARQQMQQDAAEAFAQLQQEMVKQQAGMTQRELDQLRNSLAEMRQAMQELGNQQDGMLENLQKTPDEQVAQASENQAGFEEQKADPRLADARELLNSDRMQQLQQSLQNGSESLMEQMSHQSEESPARDAQRQAMAQDQAPFKPVLGGEPPKQSPRVQQRRQQAEQAQENQTQQKQQLGDRQLDKLDQLDQAADALASDEQTLSDLLDRLDKTMTQADLPQDGMGEESSQGTPKGQQKKSEQTPAQEGKSGKSDQKGGEPSEADGNPGEQSAQTPAEQLANLMQSKQVQQAMDMANRMQQIMSNQLQSAQAADASQSQQQQNQSFTGNLEGMAIDSLIIDKTLAEFDLSSRTILLKMQPKMREELLQSLREEGPEGYREFIRSYFRRLTKVKSD